MSAGVGWSAREAGKQVASRSREGTVTFMYVGKVRWMYVCGESDKLEESGRREMGGDYLPLPPALTGR